MKIVFSLLLIIYVCLQVNGAENFNNNRNLTVDIEIAKSNLYTLLGSVKSMNYREVSFLEYLNYSGLIDSYQILAKILRFEVNEDSVSNVRNKTDTSVINISQQITTWLQTTRDLMSVTKISHFHLENEVLDSINSHINKINDKGSKIEEETLELETLMIELQDDFKSNVDIIITELTLEEQAEISSDLSKMKPILEANLNTLRFFRQQLTDNLIITLDSLKIVAKSDSSLISHSKYVFIFVLLQILFKFISL